MAELTPKQRAKLPAKEFGLPEKARSSKAKKETGNYPMPDKGHAISASGLSRKQRKAGNLTKDEFDRINRKATRSSSRNPTTDRDPAPDTSWSRRGVGDARWSGEGMIDDVGPGAVNTPAEHLGAGCRSDHGASAASVIVHAAVTSAMSSTITVDQFSDRSFLPTQQAVEVDPMGGSALSDRAVPLDDPRILIEQRNESVEVASVDAVGEAFIDL